MIRRKLGILASVALVALSVGCGSDEPSGQDDLGSDQLGEIVVTSSLQDVTVEIEGPDDYREEFLVEGQSKTIDELVPGEYQVWATNETNDYYWGDSTEGIVEVEVEAGATTSVSFYFMEREVHPLGTLSINVEGLPEELSADIVVSGPVGSVGDSSDRELSVSSTTGRSLGELDPGTYEVVAEPVDVFVATEPVQDVEIDAGDITSITIEYE